MSRQRLLPGLLSAVIMLAGCMAAAHGKGASESHLLGLYEVPLAHLTTRNMELVPPEPVFPGERLVLTTIGSEHESEEGLEFHPLVSVLVDYSFGEAPQGQWLAFWNLGHKTPGLPSHLASVFPGLVTNKQSHKGQLEKLEKRRRRLQEDPSRAGSSFPDPFLKATKKKHRDNEHLILNGFKRGLGTIVGFWSKVGPITYSANLLYRNYLLRHTDRRERQFEQAYLGLTWYTDLAYTTPGSDLLSAEAIADLKFRLLASRHFFGRWVTEEEAADFVHGFESRMREGLWGTSCYLASLANLHHLAYEEFHRYTAGGVPVALGGILYYDPALAPQPSQVLWPGFNPFDLTYNPFEDRQVQEAASSGRRVPLAVYVYQSNMALKPIIAVDFFDANNPRTREAATYWHQLGDQALAVYTGAGLIVWAANKTGSFLANRKQLTYFSDSKHSLGLEELRLSLMSHLYFEEEAADDLADSMDRLLINPLTQPTRVQAVRAQIQYLQLARPEPLLRLGRRLRTRQIGDAIGTEGRLGEESLASYRRYLKRRQDLKTLRIFLRDEHLPSVPPQQITAALGDLSLQARDPDPELVDFLMGFRLELEARTPVLPYASGWIQDIDKALVRFYEAAGLGGRQLTSDLEVLEASKKKEEQERIAEHRQHQVERFQRQTDRHFLVLKQFADNDGDLMRVPPWHLNNSLEFFARAPLVMEFYPEARIGFREVEEQIADYLDQARLHLASDRNDESVSWMEEHRLACLQTTDLARRELARLLGPRPSRAYAEAAEDRSVSGPQGVQP